MLRMMTPGAYEDRQNLYTRLLGLRVTAIVLFVFMGSAFWALQVLTMCRVFRARREQLHAHDSAAGASRHRVRSQRRSSGQQSPLVPPGHRAGADEGLEGRPSSDWPR